MSSKIKVASIGWVDNVSTTKAKSLELMWADRTIPRTQIVSIENIKCELKDIKGFWHEKEDKRADFSEYINEVNKEYRDKRNKFLSQTVDEKANNLDMFGLLWWGSTGKKEYDDTVKNKVIAIQHKFFTENTNRMYCSPFLLLEVLPAGGLVNDTRYGSHVVIERAVAEDMKQSKYK